MAADPPARPVTEQPLESRDLRADQEPNTSLAAWTQALLTADLTVTGRVVSASNLVLQASLAGPTGDALCVYKPAAGEKELWDFPDVVLGHNEVAAYLISELLDWDLVPTTVWREEAPAGPGAVQRWINEDISSEVGIYPPADVPAGFLPVLTGVDPAGHDVVVAHRDSERLRDLALFDAIINNSDRKAGHLLGDGDQIYGIDHGVSFHCDDKLRTVLWGFSGQALGDNRREALTRLRRGLHTPAVLAPLADLLGPAELEALQQRVDRLLAADSFPAPAPGWPAVPWPLW